MTSNTEAFDRWIRNDFKQMNTALEELYFAQEDRNDVAGVGDDTKSRLLEEGRSYIKALLEEGNTDEGFDSGFDLLGNVGFYMAACRRHELTNPANERKSPLVEASALAMQLGATLGMIPRFSSAHLETHNRAERGVYKSFTFLDDERIFINYNTRAVFAYIRAAEALLHTLPLGVSHSVTFDLLVAARDALGDVSRFNDELFEKLDIDRFGLCRADDPYYSQLLVDKFLFMRPEDQLVLRDCMRRKSLLDSFLESLEAGGDSPWFSKNAAVFLEVCEAHGQTAIQHHEKLVHKFIERPAEAAGVEEHEGLTASGPPLPVLLKSLRKLADLRAAAERDDIPSRYQDMKRIRAALG
jgi:hypothetical protein